MSDTQFYDWWNKNGKYIEPRRHPSPFDTMAEEFSYHAYLAAVEHCKQGEPVVYQWYEEDTGFGWVNITKEAYDQAVMIGNCQTRALFTHAMPKSEEVYELRAKNAYLLAQLKTNSIPPPPPCDNEHVADGCEKFATPQPSTDVSELVSVIDELGEHLRDKDLPSELWKRIEALIAKHTVK